jgi:hypothetical protein
MASSEGRSSCHRAESRPCSRRSWARSGPQGLRCRRPPAPQRPRDGPAPLIGQAARVAPQPVRIRRGGSSESTLVRATHGHPLPRQADSSRQSVARGPTATRRTRCAPNVGCRRTGCTPGPTAVRTARDAEAADTGRASGRTPRTALDAWTPDTYPTSGRTSARRIEDMDRTADGMADVRTTPTATVMATAR